MRVDLPLLLGAFLVVTLLALLVGAPNTGQAASYGVIAFASATVLVILKRP